MLTVLLAANIIFSLAILFYQAYTYRAIRRLSHNTHKTPRSDLITSTTPTTTLSELSIEIDDLAHLTKLHTSFCRELQYYNTSEAAHESLSSLTRLLEQAMLVLGIKRFEPTVGESYRTAFGVAEEPQIYDTNNPKLHLTIKEILEPGFKIDTQGGPRCLKPSSVSIYTTAN